MCGIAGFLTPGGDVAAFEAQARRMTDAIRYRGPDSDGYWVAEDGRVAFGHARLAIQDLSEHGAQPMHSATGRFVICYNGEVYNFREIMTELESLGHGFRGHSDTEVMLAAIEEWGIERALRRFVGMFAFALWDRNSRQLSLVRDRLGIKPLYYRCLEDRLVFGSELKAILADDATEPGVDRASLAAFLRHSYVPTPYSIFEGIAKLPPGSILTAEIGADNVVSTKLSRYWSLEHIVTNDAAQFEGSYSEAVEQLHALLGDAVSARMIADVPLGAFLSGGTDSSAVVAMMQSRSERRVSTFTVGFGEGSHNEAHWAAKVSQRLGTDHHELMLQPDDVLAVVPDLATIYDEPFSDSSQIPTILVSRLARQHVTVSLSGDGGDELFSGYKRYEAAAATWRSIGWMPQPVRGGLAAVLSPLSSSLSRVVDPLFGRIYDAFGVQGNRGGELQRAATVLKHASKEALYHYMMSHWKDPTAVVKGSAGEHGTVLMDPPEWLRNRDYREYMMLADTATYLPDDILTKVDRASMSCSLEARVPILDHRVVEFAVTLPLAFRRHDGVAKAPLKDVLGRYLPRELIDRPKMGFAIPIDDWLRGPLRNWAGDLLSPATLMRQGFLDSGPIAEKWNQHQDGSRNWAGYLWDVLMFQAWLDARETG